MDHHSKPVNMRELGPDLGIVFSSDEKVIKVLGRRDWFFGKSIWEEKRVIKSFSELKADEELGTPLKGNDDVAEDVDWFGMDMNWE